MGSPQHFNGMPVTVSTHATAELPEERWNWSAYRSPSRAKRRRDRRKVITREPACFQMGGKLVMHPVLWAKIQQEISHGK
jgi:hypothetical protein